MRILLDTCVVSELRRTDSDPRVREQAIDDVLLHEFGPGPLDNHAGLKRWKMPILENSDERRCTPRESNVGLGDLLDQVDSGFSAGGDALDEFLGVLRDIFRT